MKRNLLISLAFIFAVTLSAQGQFRKPLKSQRQGTNLALSNYTVGVKVGCPWSVMLDSNLSKVNYRGNVGYSFGIVAERYFPKFSIGLEGYFAQKGTEMHYDMPFQYSLAATDSIYHRELSLGYNVVSVRIPLTYYFKGTFKDDKIVPYIFIAPQIDIPLGFNMPVAMKNTDGSYSFFPVLPVEQTIITEYPRLNSTYRDTVTTKTQVSLNLGALAGLGLMTRIPLDGTAIIIKFDVAANYGLRNLAEEGFIWKKDESTGQIVLKENERTIRVHDLEAHLSVIIPIKKRLRDACYYIRIKN